MRKLIFSILIVILVSNSIFAQNRTFNLNETKLSNHKSALNSNEKANPIFQNSIQHRELNLNQKLQSTESISVNDTIELDLFNDKKYKAYIEKITVDVNKTLSIRARLVDFSYSYCYISTFDGKSLISIDVPDKNELFTSKYDHQSNRYYLLQIDKSKQVELEGGPPLIPPPGNEQDKNPKKKILQSPQTLEQGSGANTNHYLMNDPIKLGDAFSQDTVTLLIVYTPAAAAWSASNETNINNTISMLMANAQLALGNSNTLLTLQLVHSEQVSYTEVDISSDLSNLTSTTDGIMDNVHTLRNSYFADVVVLLEYTHVYGGLGWLLNSTSGSPGYAFSITRVQQASGTTYTTIHEIGHNMGCHHHKLQNVDSGPGLYSYSAGWRWTGSGNYCSVMTYEEGKYFSDNITHTRVPYFSNPSINYLGVATGNATDGDNARTIRQIKSVIAGYRAVSNNPSSLTGTPASSSQINLGWAKNSNNDPVMVAFNTTSVFGTPVNGSTYSAGNSITGGGTVIYKGALTTFNHTGLNPNTTYYYKAWSVLTGNQYSSGISTNATTTCNAITSFPWNEGFENGGNIPNCWTQEQVNSSGIFWTFINGNGYGIYPNSAHNGSYNAYLKDDTPEENKTRLISPPINLSLLGSPTLTFWHTQARWDYDQDTLTVFYKTSLGGAWTQLAKYSSNITSWTEETISLPNGTSTYYINFEGNATWGLGICIDDVEITGTSVPPNLDITDEIVGNGESICYDATDTIFVAGTDTVEFLSGSSVELIAGTSIFFLPGFFAEEGSNVHAHITTEALFCGALPDRNIVGQNIENITAIPENTASIEKTVNNERNIKVYPNPNNGRFILELNNFEGPSRISIINTLGSIVYQTKVTNDIFSELDLSYLSKGLYFVNVQNGDIVKTNKIIVQ